MNILITAIGSMSAACAIQHLKAEGHFIVGCDIYPGEWHHETKLCDVFLRAPFATREEEYIPFLLETCRQYGLSHIIPLTDLEIDVINRHRTRLEDAGIVLCMQQAEVLAIARDKYKLSELCQDDPNIPAVRTCRLSEMSVDFQLPCIAKPYNGRSSEGLIRNATREQLMAIENKDGYIVQEQLDGGIFTVDFCRNAQTGVSCAVPRRELLRTQNGAGLTVQTIADENLVQLVTYIGHKLNIHGCVNMEFILSEGHYYLIDVNPRFSAGVAFSVIAGYDMITNHIRCFCHQDIDGQIEIKEQIMIKKYEEVIS